MDLSFLRILKTMGRTMPKFNGEKSFLVRQRSSSKAVSSCQCKLFSIPRARPRGSRRDRRPRASSQSASRRMVAPFSWRCALPRWRRCDVYFGRGVAFFQPVDDVPRAARSIRARTNARRSTVVAGSFLLCCKALAFQYYPRARGTCLIRRENRTKTFHVKHFGTIGAENLTRAHTPRKFETFGIARKIGRGCQMMGRPQSGDLPIKQR